MALVPMIRPPGMGRMSLFQGPEYPRRVTTPPPLKRASNIPCVPVGKKVCGAPNGARLVQILDKKI